jgi:4-diphosphocytidyl-2-C-methyl-D-erythritol kinase
VRIEARAKINLGLEVLRRRTDGYHDIRTLFQEISLSDVLEIDPRLDSLLRLEGDDPSVAWGETNLVSRAASALRAASGRERGADLRVWKKIPPGGGLGGGSSDAAAALVGLDAVWQTGFSRDDLAGIGRTLGADVPFFLQGGLCLGEERGDRLTELPDLPPLFVVLAFPGFPVSTALVYRSLDADALTSKEKDSRIIRFLRTGELGFLENRLEETIFRLFPELKDYPAQFRRNGAELSLVAGSGSAVFGLFRDRPRAERCLADMRSRGEAVLAETVPQRQGRLGFEAGASPSGKAADFGSAIRGFESSRPSSDRQTEGTRRTGQRKRS